MFHPRFLPLVALLSACSANAPVQLLDLANLQNPPVDLAVTSADLAVTPVGGQCPCAQGTYCDLASNTCKLGCAFDADCASGHCNQTTHQCFTPGAVCGSVACTPTQQCCLLAGAPTCAPSCPGDMGSITVSCSGPGDCPSGSAPICCAHLAIGASPGCAYTATVMCQSACALQLPAGCGMTGQAQVCKAKSDCQDAANPNCCTFAFQGQSGSLCVSDSYTALATGCL